MFVSTLMLTPWFVYGFQHGDSRFIGLNQTKQSVLTLLIIEIFYFGLLLVMLDKPDPNIAGRGDFAWTYQYFYEKGIFPLLGITENFNPISDVIIEQNYKWLYLITALLVDYVLLFIISPRPLQTMRQLVSRK